MRFYVDVHRLANKNRKNKTEEQYHVFTVDGVEFTKAKRMADIPAGCGDELFVDVIPIELTDEFIEMLRRGVKVYYLRRLSMIRVKREELGLKTKNSKNDLKAMMSIESKWFREVDEDFLVMRRKISAYRGLLKDRQSKLKRMKNLSDDEKEVYGETLVGEDMAIEKMAQLVVDEARKRIPYFGKIAEVLGINGDNHLKALEALAELMTYIDFSKGFNRVCRYVGLFKGKKKIYDGRLRKALQRLTITLYKKDWIKAKEEKMVLRKIWATYRRETQKKAGGHTGLNNKEKTQTRPVCTLSLRSVSRSTEYLSLPVFSGFLRCCSGRYASGHHSLFYPFMICFCWFIFCVVFVCFCVVVLVISWPLMVTVLWAGLFRCSNF